MNLPQVHPDREPLTEQEARRMGVAANRLPRLRKMLGLAANRIGSITVGAGGGGVWQANNAAESMSLGSIDLQAALALLIERDELLLASFNVTIERK